MERLVESFGEERPRLLLHCCCGPCSSAVLEYLSARFDLTLLWYNPNIYPEAEYEKRYAALTELIEKMELSGRLTVMREPWQSEVYRARVKGLESEPEGGARCPICFRLRLERTAELAREQGFDYFCTTLTVSRHKDAVLLNALGEAVAQEYGVKWLPSDFKKKNGENRSVELSEKYQIYRQLYCGCEFSLRRREQGAQGQNTQAEGARTQNAQPRHSNISTKEQSI